LQQQRLEQVNGQRPTDSRFIDKECDMNLRNNAWRFMQALATITTTHETKSHFLSLALTLIASTAFSISLVVKAQAQNKRALAREI